MIKSNPRLKPLKGGKITQRLRPRPTTIKLLHKNNKTKCVRWGSNLDPQYSNQKGFTEFIYDSIKE